LAKERAHLGAECTEDEEEHEAAWCQEAMSRVLNVTAKRIRISAGSQRVWNSDIVRACMPAFGLIGIRMVIIGIRLQTWMRVILDVDE